MVLYVYRVLKAMRPAFSREATFVWFVIVFAGFVTRTDVYGVSSIVRALHLAPVVYPSLIHFFHSAAWSSQSLLSQWWQWTVAENVAYMTGGRLVLLGDHTKIAKDGRKMPEVCTLHQDSETGSKPSFFRGHHWGCISLLICAKQKFSGMPLWAEIHRDDLEESRTTRIVTVALKIAQAMGYPAYLVLDAFFAVGPVFQVAGREGVLLHVLTRAKKNVVAYLSPLQQKKRTVGRPRMYGERLKLMELFDTWADRFVTTDAHIYGTMEPVRYLVLDLLWKPVKGTLRFVLIESSRGKIILMTSDLTIEPLVAITLYCRRVSIETLFNSLKNLLGGMKYHFWSRYLTSSSRRPAKKGTLKPLSTRPEKTRNTLAAIEKFVLIQMFVLGNLQLLACRFSKEINTNARCWLRTPCGDIPSEFVTRTAISNIIRTNLISFAKDWMTQLILRKKSVPAEVEDLEDAA